MSTNILKIDFTKYCRCCMKIEETAIPIYYEVILENDCRLVVGDMLNIFQNLKGQNDKSLPNLICISCFNQLYQSYSFYEKSLDTLQKFNDIINLCSSFSNDKTNTVDSLGMSTGTKIPPLVVTKSVNYKTIIPKNDEQVILPTLAQSTIMPEIVPNLYERDANENEVVEETNDFLCKLCNKQYPSKASFTNHMRYHENFTCFYCNFVFLTEDNMKQHVAEDHADLNFSCNHCAATFSKRKNILRHHRDVHKIHNSLYYCGICRDFTIGYKSLAIIEQHISENHNNGRVNECLTEIKPELDESEQDTFVTDESPNIALNAVSFMDGEILDENDMIIADGDGIEEGCENYGTDGNGDVDIPSDTMTDSMIQIESDENAIHLINSLYRCTKCDELFDKQSNVVKHLAEAHKINSILCNICGATYNQIDEYELHRKMHVQDEEHSFDVNSNDNVNLSTYYDTVTIDNQLLYKCKSCAKTFCRKSNLFKHKCCDSNKKNDGDKSGATTTTSSSSPIANDNLYRCNICAAEFNEMKLLYKHSKLHGSENISCNLCNKQFKTIPGLKYHMKTHSGQKPYTCLFCEKRFMTTQNLNAHIRIAHSDNRPYACEYCTRKFTTIDHLKKHTLQHTNEKKFLCPECGKQFYQQSHLKQHLLRHKGIKPFSCNYCDVSYNGSHALKKHLEKRHAAEFGLV